jgi:hypothetical protein
MKLIIAYHNLSKSANNANGVQKKLVESKKPGNVGPVQLPFLGERRLDFAG